MRVSYDAVDANKRIARLRTDLKCTYNELKHNICAKERAKLIPNATGVVDESLKMASAMQVQKRALNDENERLRKKVEQLEGVVNTEDFERAKYMEGAAWMAKLLAEESEKYLATLEGLCNNYRTKKREKETKGEANQMYLSAIQTWFIENVEAASSEFKMKVHGIKANTVYQAEKLRGKVKKAVGKTGRG